MLQKFDQMLRFQTKSVAHRSFESHRSTFGWRSASSAGIKHAAKAPAVRGFTLLELIVAVTIVSLLSLLAVPMAKIKVQREREKQLRHALWEMRDAIDRYREAADRNAFQTKVDSQHYPPDLETLTTPIEMQGDKKILFLRSIPMDPMTKSKEWGLRSMDDDPESDSWGGEHVFDVYSKSDGTALDGTRYRDW